MKPVQIFPARRRTPLADLFELRRSELFDRTCRPEGIPFGEMVNTLLKHEIQPIESVK